MASAREPAASGLRPVQKPLLSACPTRPQGDALTQPQGQVVLPPYEKPPMWMQQFNKAAAVLLNSGLVALIRSWYNPPKAEVGPQRNIIHAPATLPNLYVPAF